MNNEPILVPWHVNENVPTIIPKEITKETLERYYHETPNLYYTKFNINTKEND